MNRSKNNENLERVHTGSLNNKKENAITIVALVITKLVPTA